MREIKLHSGECAKVDDEDFDRLSVRRWFVFKNGNCKYARTRYRGKYLLMHRVILGLKPGINPDHINGDGLDNRRCNLRIASKSQNAVNVRKYKGSSRFKGVSRHKSGKWRAYSSITTCGKEKQVHLGLFDNEKKAAIAYNAFILKAHGAFAVLNDV